MTPPELQLQWGVVRPRGGGRALPALRLGEEAVVLATLASAGLLAPDAQLARALGEPDLNALVELGPPAWADVLDRVRALAHADALPASARVALSACEALLPVRVVDFVDFYASLEHATNFGRIFRPGAPPVRENWRFMPVGYHGRASSIIVSGTPVRRPRGQVALGELAPTRELDLECELGFVCGPTARGPVAIDDA